MVSANAKSTVSENSAMKSSPRLILLFLGILVIFAVTSYASTFNAPFVFDDISQIAENSKLHLTSLSWGQIGTIFEGGTSLRPLAFISLALNYYLAGTDPVGYHVVNLLIHLLTAVGLFFLLIETLRIGTRETKHGLINLTAHSSLDLYLIAFFAVLLWMISPLQTNAVSYIVQRMTSLAVMFYIFALLLYVKARIRIRGKTYKTAALYFAGCLICIACAVTSKEIAATLPFIILLYEWYFFQDLRSLKSKKFIIAGALAIIIFLAVAHFYLGGHPVQRILRPYRSLDFTLTERVFTELRVIAYYVSLIVFPHPDRLNLDYDYPLSDALLSPMTTGIAAAALFALVLLALYAAKNYRLLSFCLLWFLGNLIIESSVVGIEIIYEHRLYLPSMMISLALVGLIYRYIKVRWASVAILGAIAVLLCAWTHQRNQIWSDNISFWRDCAIKSPNKARTWQNLAYSYAHKDQHAKAARYYRKSLKIEKDADTYYKRGFSLAKLGHHVSAAEAFLEALKMDYRKNNIQSQLAYEFAAMGEFKKALKYYKQAIEENPDDQTARQNRRALIKFLKRCQTPMACVKKSIRRNPDNPALYFKLGILFESKNKPDQAIQAYENALDRVSAPRSDPKLYDLAAKRLAMAYERSGETDQAIRLLLEAVDKRPDDPHRYYRLSALYARKGSDEKSLDWMKKAIDKGFNDLKRILLDARFKDLLAQEEFQQLLKKIR